MSHEGDDLAAELAEPVAALPRHFGTGTGYDPRGRNPLTSLARRALIGLLRWWIDAIVSRQDHFNRLVTRALEQLERGDAARLEARVRAVEQRLRERDSDAALAELEARSLAAAAAAPPALADEIVSAVAEALAGREVLVLGDAPLSLLRRLRVALVVSDDAEVVRRAGAAGAAARQLGTDVHLQETDDRSIGAAFSATEVQRTALPQLAVRLRRLSRALAPGAPLVLVAPDPATGQGLVEHWQDPAARTPVPAELLVRVLEASGFPGAQVRSLGGRLIAVAPAGPSGPPSPPPAPDP